MLDEKTKRQARISGIIALVFLILSIIGFVAYGMYRNAIANDPVAWFFGIYNKDIAVALALAVIFLVIAIISGSYYFSRIAKKIRLHKFIAENSLISTSKFFASNSSEPENNHH